MKFKSSIQILIALFVLSLFSCSSDDGNVTASNDTMLVGTWILKENRNTQIPRTVEAPTDENPIRMIFLGETFKGNTSVNEFSGTYSTNTGVLILNELNTTEVSDTAWGNQFYFALSMGVNTNTSQIELKYEVTANTLIIEFAANQFLYFEKFGS